MSTQTGYKAQLTEEQQERIIADSLPFIKYTAFRLSRRLPPQLTTDDMVSVGIVGLLDALQRYEEGRVKLKTFVEHRIRGAMLDELRAHDWAPRSLKKKAEAVKKAHRELEQELGRLPNEEEIAESLEIGLDEYHRILQDVHGAVTVSFDDAIGGAQGDGGADVHERIADPGARTPLELLEAGSRQEALAGQIACLPEKEKLVLSLYYWDELTMKEIGAALRITEGRVCQLHSQALIRLKSRLEAPGEQ